MCVCVCFFFEDPGRKAVTLAFFLRGKKKKKGECPHKNSTRNTCVCMRVCVCVRVCAWCVLKACSRRLAVGESGNAASVIIGSDDDSCTAKTTNAPLFPPLIFSSSLPSHLRPPSLSSFPGLPFDSFIFSFCLLSFIVLPPPPLSFLISSCIVPCCIWTVGCVSCLLPVSLISLIFFFFFASFLSCGSFLFCLPHTFSSPFHFLLLLF